MANATNPAFHLLDPADDHAGARVRRIGGLTLWAETLAFRCHVGAFERIPSLARNGE